MPVFLKLCYQFTVALPLRSQANEPPCIGRRHIPDGDQEIIPWHYLEPFSRPFNHTDSIAIEIVLQPEANNFAGGIEAIKINVVQWKSAVIFSDYNEGRTEGVFFDVQPVSDALNQTSLACPQFACEEENISLSGQFP